MSLYKHMPEFRCQDAANTPTTATGAETVASSVIFEPVPKGRTQMTLTPQHFFSWGTTFRDVQAPGVFLGNSKW